MHSLKTSQTAQARQAASLTDPPNRSTIAPSSKSSSQGPTPWLDFVPNAERRWLAHFVADADSALNQLLRLPNLLRTFLSVRL